MRAERTGVPGSQIVPEALVGFPFRRPAPSPVDRRRRGYAPECHDLKGAVGWRQQPQPGGQAARPEHEGLGSSNLGRLAELGWEVAPAEPVRRLLEEHDRRARLVIPLRSPRVSNRIAKEKQPAPTTEILPVRPRKG